MHVAQSKNQIMMNVVVGVRNRWLSFCKGNICLILLRVIVNVIRHANLINIYTFEITHAKGPLIGKLVLLVLAQ